MTRRIFEVGDIVDYRHGGKLEVVFVDRGGWLPYQCCLPGGDTKKNAWFSQTDLREPAEPNSPHREGNNMKFVDFQETVAYEMRENFLVYIGVILLFVTTIIVWVAAAMLTNGITLVMTLSWLGYHLYRKTKDRDI